MFYRVNSPTKTNKQCIHTYTLRLVWQKNLIVHISILQDILALGARGTTEAVKYKTKK